MKKYIMRTIVGAAIIAVALFTVVTCSSVKVTPERINEVSRKVETKDFTIDVNYANPLRGRQIYLNYNYSLKIQNDSAFAFLPYFGVAHTAPYGGGEGGIKFEEPMKDYSYKPTQKNDGWDISFNVDDRMYNYDITLKIFNNGSSTITVNSYQRDPITFSGNMQELTTQ